MLLRACHRTLYRYRTPAFDSHNEVRLMPLSDVNQTCESFQLTVSPESAIHAYQEAGGTVHYFSHRNAHDLLEITAEATVETHLSDPFRGLNLLEDDWAFYSQESTAASFAEYLSPSRFVEITPEVVSFAHRIKRDRPACSGSTAQFLIDLGHAIHEEFDYQSGLTDIHTTVDEVLALKAGVCQDFAHLMIACCRVLGIPARYVSGYLLGEINDPMRGDHATHAWIECPMPDGRWLAIDPTNDLIANDRYIRIHTGRDYSEVPPTRGVYTGTPAQSLDVSVWVERIEAEVPV